MAPSKPAAPTLSALITSAEQGDSLAAARLFDMLYAELHRLARNQLARSGGPVTLGATTLIHEAYLQMAGRDGAFPDEARFLGYAARVMRGLIIDYARSRGAEKRGGEFHLTSLDADVAGHVPDARELTSIGEALDELGRVEPLLAQIVDLKFFCGFSFGEIATMQRTSERTVQRKWEKARLYLHRALAEDGAG